LIEAGVDVDFPVVFRAQTGIDSIAQSAGRCNREGKNDRGKVFVFPSEHPIPRGFLKTAAQKARETIDRFEEDLLSPEAVLDYFKRYYWETPNKDKFEIIDLCAQGLSQEMDFPFEKIGNFSLIEKTTNTIYVPYSKKAERLIEQLRRMGPSRMLLRKLQPFQVQIYTYALETFVNAGAIDKIDNLYVLNQSKYYCERLGLIPPSIPDKPEDYIV
jgi:CRISPR-associated endonuclease/helicase Cas3